MAARPLQYDAAIFGPIAKSDDTTVESPQLDNRVDMLCLRIARAAGLLAATIGVISLIGCNLGISIVQRINPNWAEMKANSAVSLILLGLVCSLFHSQLWTKLKGPAAFSSLLVALVSLATIAEYLLGTNLGIDTIIAGEPAGAPATSIAGRMSPNTAAALALLAVAFASRSLTTFKEVFVIQIFGTMAAFIAVLSFAAQIYGAGTFSGFGSHTAMSGHSALSIVALSVGLILLDPDRGIMRAIRGENSSARLTRRILPVSILVSLSFSWFCVVGERSNLFTEAYGAALLGALAIFGSFAICIAAANWLNREEEARRHFEAALVNSNIQLARALERAEGANRDLEAFSYSVSHDLRSPLRAVDGFAKILADEHGSKLDPDAHECLAFIQDGAQRMGMLIDALLRFSRIGSHPIESIDIDMNAVVRTALRDLESERSGRHVEIVVEELLPCAGDLTLVRQAMANLLSNAIKYTRGRDTAHITVSSRASKDLIGYVEYTVSDNGTGFDMAYADKLFRVFQRLHRAEDFEGIGIGLALTQRIISRHGGRVRVEAAPDRGATFTISLPSPSHD